MRAVLRGMKAISENPWLSLSVGLILLVTGLNEAWETLAEDLKGLEFGTSHAVLMLGLVHVLRALPELFEGLEYAVRGSEGEARRAETPPLPR